MPPFAYRLPRLGRCAMLVLDIIWLTLAVPRIYKPALGDLLADKPNLAVAGVFYLLYVVGVVVFAVLPALETRSWLQAAGTGRAARPRRLRHLRLHQPLDAARLAPRPEPHRRVLGDRPDRNRGAGRLSRDAVAGAGLIICNRANYL